MIFKNFTVNIIIRITILLITCLLLAFALRNPNHFFTIGFYFILIVIQIVLLINYLNKTNKELNQFYQSVINEDSTVSFQKKPLRKQPVLSETLNSITSQISQLRYEKEVSYSYLKQVVNHLNTGIIAFKPNGQVDLVNQATLSYLGLNELNNINQLKDFGDPFYQRIINPSITGNETIEIKRNQSKLKFSLRSSMFRLGNQNIQLVSFQNIKEELELNELKSWEKLIRVITHEIMNSVSPIVSLTKTLGNIFVKKEKPVNPDNIEENHIQDTIKGLNIIKRRGNGLLDFVKKIRQVHLLPTPIKEEIKVKELFEGVFRLLKFSLEENKIHYSVKVHPETLQIYADRNLVEQVIINLVKNSLEALDETREKLIEINAFEVNSRKIIEVADNGKGIPPELAEDIFIPFYSTKNEGSGIGLSLSRQVMRFHGGNIYVRSIPYEKTVFTLKF